MKKCPLCKAEVPELLFESDVTAVLPVITRIKGDHPSWSEHQGICVPCLRVYENLSEPPQGNPAS